MTTRHLDIGGGATPRNPYGCDEVHVVDIVASPGVDASRLRVANLSLEPIPHPDSSFDSVSAFDFLEHIPRVLATADSRSTRFPFVELMNEVHRVLRPNGLFYALTPAYPSSETFQDPTHVNFIADETWRYFCGTRPQAQAYGFTGRFEMLRNERALFPEAFTPSLPVGLRRRYRRWRLQRTGRLSHLMWEFACIKPPLATSAQP
jgi:SAM-dependent methyltransferase